MSTSARSSTNALLAKNFDLDTWKKSCAEPYFALFFSTPPRRRPRRSSRSADAAYEASKKVFIVEDEEGEDLCKCDFSLAYGALILLNNATLHMKKGKRYGLCGPNGCGKSTLMKAINNGQVEGFPPPEELRTVYVEHDIQGDQHDDDRRRVCARRRRHQGPRRHRGGCHEHAAVVSSSPTHDQRSRRRALRWLEDEARARARDLHEGGHPPPRRAHEPP